MSPADRLDALRAIGVRVALAPDGERLAVTGPAVLLAAALPAINTHRAALRALLIAEGRVIVGRFAGNGFLRKTTGGGIA